MPQKTIRPDSLQQPLSTLPTSARRSSAGHSRRIFGVRDKLINLNELPKNCEHQQGCGEDGPLPKECHASVQAKVRSSGSGNYSCSYFCSHATSTSPCYRFGGNRLRGALLIKKLSVVFINDLWGTRNRPNHFLHLVPTPLLHPGVLPGQKNV